MGFESRKQTSRAGNLRLLAGCAAQWFKGGEGFRVALTGRCMSGRSHQGRGFGSARALPGAHRRRWPPHAPCGRDCAIMRRLIGLFHRNKTNFSGGDGPIYSSHSAEDKLRGHHLTRNSNKCTPFREKSQNGDLITQYPFRYKLKTQRIWNPGGAPSSNPLSFQFVPKGLTR